MLKNVMLTLVLAFLMVSSGILVVTGEEGDSAQAPDDVRESGIVQSPGEKVLDIDEMAAAGVGRIRTYQADDVQGLMSQLRSDFFRKNGMSISSIGSSAGGKDENDGFNNATEVFNGDRITNNVTSWITYGTQIVPHFNDMDYYLVNLTINGPAGRVDRLIIDINSTSATDKKATLTTDFFYPDMVLGQWTYLDCELTGKHHGSDSRFVYTPKGDPTSTYILPIIFRFLAWNTTTIQYTFKVDIKTVSRTGWNGEIGGATFVNGTIRPSPMQNVNISDEFYDWYDLSAVITDAGLDQSRADKVKFSLKVDAATEERGQLGGYIFPNAYGRKFNMTSIMFAFFLYHNYTSGQWTLYSPDGQSLPYVSQRFGNNDPINLGFSNEQVDAVYLGVSPLKIWIYGNQGFAGPTAGAEGNAEYYYNITNVNVQILPPNDPPAKIGNIPDFAFDEDTGPWEDVVDLEQYFSDDWSDNDLLFEVKPVVTPPTQLSVEIAPDGRHLRINVTQDNWYTPPGAPVAYQIAAYDWGQDWKRASGDDLKVLSNVFKVTINPVNDDAYIQKVDTLAGTVENDHDWIVFQLTQTQSVKTRKVFGMDNDTADKNNLIYTSNSTTSAFRMNDKGQFDFIPTNENVGTTWIRVAVDDGNPPEEDDYCLLKFVVTNINDGPELLSIRNRDTGATFDLTKTAAVSFFNILEDSEVNLTVTAFDPDIAIYQPDQLTWTVAAVGWAVHRDDSDPFTAYITYTPTNDDAIVGEARTKFFVRDSQQLTSDEIEIILYIDNVNDPPTILSVNDEPVHDGAVTLDSQNRKGAKEDEIYTLTIEAEDIDPKDAVTFVISDPASYAPVPVPEDDYAMSYQILPTQEMVGLQQVIITVMDKKERKTSVRVSYEVNGTNDPPDEPRIEYQALTGLKVDQPITFIARDYGDIDGDELDLEWNFGDGSPFGHGAEVVHVYAFENSFTITLIARDPSGAEAIARKSIIIAPKEIDVNPDLDTDGDGMPDVWENLYSGFDVNDASDANEDFDDDGFTNLEEYNYKDASGNRSNPLDKNVHPPVTAVSTNDSTLLIVIIIASVLILVIIIVLFAFLLRTPKQVQPQRMYAMEASPQLPPRPVQQLQPTVQPQLPPKPPEEDLMTEFLEEAAKEVKQSMDIGQEEENVWRPPAPSEEPEKSQVEDLFEEETAAEGKGPSKMDPLMPPPAPPK